MVSYGDDLDLGLREPVDQGVRISTRKRVSASVGLAARVTGRRLENRLHRVVELEKEAARRQRASYCIPIAGVLRIEESLDVPARITRSH